MNIPFLSIFGPALPEPGTETAAGVKAASTGGEFMSLMETYRNGMVFADNSGDVHAEAAEAQETVMSGALHTGRQIHDGSGEVPAALAGPADLLHQANYIPAKFFEGSEPQTEAVKNNIQLLEPAHYEGSNDPEGKGSGFVADSQKEFKAQGLEYAAFPASRPIAANEVKETQPGNGLAGSDAPTEAAVPSDRQYGHGNAKADINVPGPAVPVSEAQAGRDRAVHSEDAGPAEDASPVISAEGERIAGHFERAPYQAIKEPVLAARGETHADAAVSGSAWMAQGSESAAGSGSGERVRAVPPETPSADGRVTGNGPDKTGQMPLPEEDMGSAERPGIEVSGKEPDAADNIAPRLSQKTESLHAGTGPLHGSSPRPVAVAVENALQKDIANGVPAARTDAYVDSNGQEGADAPQAEGANEFSLKDAGETGLKLDLSQDGDGGRPEAEPDAQRPALGALPGAAFRNLVDSAPAYRPEPQAYPVEMGKQLDEVLRISVRNGGGEVRMKLNPESLGELSIRLSISNGAVTAEITAESLEAKALLEANSSMLKDSLAQQGLVLRECVISVSSRVDAGLPERREGLFEERREEARGSGSEGKDGRKSGYDGSSQRKYQPAYGGIDLFA